MCFVGWQHSCAHHARAFGRKQSPQGEERRKKDLKVKSLLFSMRATRSLLRPCVTLKAAGGCELQAQERKRKKKKQRERKRKKKKRRKYEEKEGKEIMKKQFSFLLFLDCFLHFPTSCFLHHLYVVERSLERHVLLQCFVVFEILGHKLFSSFFPLTPNLALRRFHQSLAQEKGSFSVKPTN